jgi:hypothetical protein
VYVFIRKILQTKLLARRPQVPILIKVPSHRPIVTHEHTVHPYVKLPLIYQQRILYVLLHYQCPRSRRIRLHINLLRSIRTPT